MDCRWQASACSDVAQFDVHADPAGRGLLLVCQADLLSHLNTRLVAPLLPIDQAPKPAGRLNPVFEIEGKPHFMVTQFASAVELRELGPRVESLANRHHEIMNALDMLLTGI
jgi:toxin CcdB